MKQTGSIYIIRNTVNDKVYIGQTTMPVQQRFKQHLKPSTCKRKSSYKFYNAINKYGKDKFYVETLETDIPVSELDAKEVAYIKEYDSCDNGYNTSYGGNVRRIHEPRDIENILQLYVQGKTTSEIAKIYNVSTTTILRTIQGSGYDISKKPLDKNVLQYYVEHGYTNQEIADLLGSKRWTVERYLQRYGIRRKRIFICHRPDFDWNGIEQDIKNGLQQKELVKKYDISEGTFYRIKKAIKEKEY